MKINTSKITCTIIVCFVVFFQPVKVYSQENDKVWDLLLQNKRQEALKLVSKKKYVKDVKSLFTKKIVETDNGNFIFETDFYQQMLNSSNFEPYLFAFWNQSFLFNEYHNNGYTNNIGEIIEIISKYKYTYSTLENAVTYLLAVKQRQKLQWEKFFEYGNKINRIQNWEYTGVFENLNNSGLSIYYKPETFSNPKEPFDGRNIGELNWYKAPESHGDPYQFFTNHSEHGYGVNYGQTFIQSPESQRVIFRIGAGGKIRVFLNDVLIFENDKELITEMDAYNIEANLQKGNNRLLIKLANENVYPYYLVRIEDTNGKVVTNVENDISNKKYTKSSLEAIQPKILENPIIQYLKNEYQKKPNSFFNTYSLFKGLMRYGRYEEAKDILNKWLVKYPDSSFLKVLLATCYNAAEDYTESQKLFKNIQTKDPDYYFSLLLTFKDTDALFKKDLKSYRETLDKIKNTIQNDFIQNSCELFWHLRTQDKDSLELYLNKVIENNSNSQKTYLTFVKFYDKLLNKENITIQKLEKHTQSNLSYNIRLQLSYYYEKINKKELALTLLKDVLDYLNEDNNAIYDYVNLLHKQNKYEESIPYIKKALANYPYSTVFNELMGDVYYNTGNKKKSLQFYQEALDRYPTNSSLRKKIFDLKNQENPLDKLRTKDFYTYIKNTKRKIKENNYGSNILLDETNVFVYQKGGGRYTVTYIYEVTSNDGVENLKEYDLNLYGDYVIYKSEIIKPDGSIVPAEKSGSNLVFNGLETGDVILIDFENNFTKHGRFYKDFIDAKTFRGFDPAQKRTYRILTPKNDIKYICTIEDIPLNKYKFEEYNVYEWSKTNLQAIPLYEAYMPPKVDVASKLHISTITSWDVIAKWYSDLVRSQIIIDDKVKNAFKTIFPNGISNLSENEKAKAIYNYVTGNFTYSYVSFKQSGFVPQKPSKTIATKLGDCKDFSTLFVALSKLANLDAKLVLILTSDYGQNDMLLPSTDFNHCIVKVMINGKEQFLELTDKYLPYKTLPISLHQAYALEIPFNSNDTKTYNITKLNNLNRIEDTIISIADVYIDNNDSIKVKLTTKVNGHLSSSYISMFEEKNKETLKKDVNNEISKRISQEISVLSIDSFSVNKNSLPVKYTATLSVTEKINKIASLKAIKIPFFLNPYNASIIELQERKYPIEYKKYENLDTYQETITIHLPDNNAFAEIPENKDLSFKNHFFKITYSLINPNTLNINMVSSPGKGKIQPKDYPEFKKYVQDVLEVKKTLIAYK